METGQLSKLPLSHMADLPTRTHAHCRRQSRAVGLERDPEVRDCVLVVLGHQACGTPVSSLGLESTRGRADGPRGRPGKSADPRS